MGANSIVILESASRWPAWMGDDPPATNDVAVVAQRQGESLTAFKRRATQQIRSLQATRPPLTAVLVCGAGRSTESFAFRHFVLQQLLAMMQRAGRGHLVLVADADHAQQRRLAWLAAGLSEQLDEDSMVSLRFRVMPQPNTQAATQRGQALRVA
jgi:hypothetical protein